MCVKLFLIRLLDLERGKEKLCSTGNISICDCVSVAVCLLHVCVLSSLTGKKIRHTVSAYVRRRNAFKVSHTNVEVGTCALKRQLLKSITAL